MSTSHCAIHDKDEEIPTDRENVEVCFECGHVYPTPMAVLEAYAEVYPQAEFPDDIPFCPLCLHDW